MTDQDTKFEQLDVDIARGFSDTHNVLFELSNMQRDALHVLTQNNEAIQVRKNIDVMDSEPIADNSRFSRAMMDYFLLLDSFKYLTGQRKALKKSLKEFKVSIDDIEAEIHIVGELLQIEQNKE